MPYRARRSYPKHGAPPPISTGRSPLGNGRALNPPLATARLLIAAAINPGDHVLLVGAATGYAAALLARLGCPVVALEEDAGLAAQAKTALSDYAGINIVTGPLAKGHVKARPMT